MTKDACAKTVQSRQQAWKDLGKPFFEGTKVSGPDMGVPSLIVAPLIKAGWDALQKPLDIQSAQVREVLAGLSSCIANAQLALGKMQGPQNIESKNERIALNV